MSKNRSFVRLTQRRAIRKADEFTLRADEVGTLRGFINTDHIEFGQVGDRRWWMRTGMPSAKSFTKELKGKNGKSCILTTEI